ncbi:MAG: hypothetical protein E7374_00010 [Clostridiales bacterium]|nr:hypothetical protein [Clostridiales bacterium]
MLTIITIGNEEQGDHRCVVKNDDSITEKIYLDYAKGEDGEPISFGNHFIVRNEDGLWVLVDEHLKEGKYPFIIEGLEIFREDAKFLKIRVQCKKGPIYLDFMGNFHFGGKIDNLEILKSFERGEIKVEDLPDEFFLDGDSFRLILQASKRKLINFIKKRHPDLKTLSDRDRKEYKLWAKQIRNSLESKRFAIQICQDMEEDFEKLRSISADHFIHEIEDYFGDENI